MNLSRAIILVVVLAGVLAFWGVSTIDGDHAHTVTVSTPAKVDPSTQLTPAQMSDNKVLVAKVRELTKQRDFLADEVDDAEGKEAGSVAEHNKLVVKVRDLLRDLQNGNR